MKVVVIESNTFLDQKIERVLTSNGIALDFTSKLNQAMLKMYDAVIFSYKNTIPALPKVIERICLEKKILVVYINNVPSIGQFFSVLNDHYFRMVNDLTIEIELPLIIHSSSKYIR
jgi:ubiquinone/menaquinone biosynthesis C-methylase UbiE